MPDVKVTRELCQNVRGWYDENDPEAHGQTFAYEDQVRALCALAEAVLGVADKHFDGDVDEAWGHEIHAEIRRLLGKEERPGE